MTEFEQVFLFLGSMSVMQREMILNLKSVELL